LSRLPREAGVRDGAALAQALSPSPASRLPTQRGRTADAAEVARTRRSVPATAPQREQPAQRPAPHRAATESVGRVVPRPEIAGVAPVGPAQSLPAVDAADASTSALDGAQSRGLSDELLSFATPFLRGPALSQAEWRAALEGLGERLTAFGRESAAHEAVPVIRDALRMLQQLRETLNSLIKG
jgi:hypothetical protein